MSPHESDNYDNFEYVLTSKTQQRICFGSTKERKLYVHEPATPPNVGPCTYQVEKYAPLKPRSKKGIPGLANTAKRICFGANSFGPAPCKYNTTKFKSFKRSYAPFDSTVPILQYMHIKEGPGPTVYNPHMVRKSMRTRLDNNFGKPQLVPAVEIVCINYPNKKCEKCGEPFEFGDFWHKNYIVYLCCFCMAEEHRLHEMYSKRELHTFKKIRTCTFMHRHEGTSAAIRLLDKHELNKKLRIENYLSLYVQCYGTKSRPEGR